MFGVLNLDTLKWTEVFLVAEDQGTCASTSATVTVDYVSTVVDSNNSVSEEATLTYDREEDMLEFPDGLPLFRLSEVAVTNADCQ